MANLCLNWLSIEHTDPLKVIWLMEQYTPPNFFENIKPTPEHTKGLKSDDPGGWYDWRINNWGVKRDVEITDLQQHFDKEDTTKPLLIINFTSAWCPPLKMYNHLAKLGFRFNAEYFEPGMGFGGFVHTENAPDPDNPGSFINKAINKTIKEVFEEPINDQLETTFNVSSYIINEEDLPNVPTPSSLK